MPGHDGGLLPQQPSMGGDARLLQVVYRGLLRAQALEVRVADGDHVLPALPLVLRVEALELVGDRLRLDMAPKALDVLVGRHLGLVILNLLALLCVDDGDLQLLDQGADLREEIRTRVPDPVRAGQRHEHDFAKPRRGPQGGARILGALGQQASDFHLLALGERLQAQGGPPIEAHVVAHVSRGKQCVIPIKDDEGLPRVREQLLGCVHAAKVGEPGLQGRRISRRAFRRCSRGRRRCAMSIDLVRPCLQGDAGLHAVGARAVDQVPLHAVD
mmetsp:Transcript_52759/g.153763  ORF Transcript_52759/g.153763 Transcript_52759/m.153763 type:complete len:272 (+) Transcript_52759:254-1069(+)